MKNTTAGKLLIVDDDTNYSASLRTFLEIENYEVDEVASVEEANKHLGTNQCDLVLVDVRLNRQREDDVSGWEVAKKARESGIPCIMITAYPSVEVENIFLNSRSGESLAVDFVQKKHGPLVILGVVQAILGRKRNNRQLEAPLLEVDLEKGLVFLGGKPVKLAQKQYDLLACLAQKEGAVTGHSMIIQAVYGEKLTEQQAKNDSRLERLVERVREKIEEDPASPRYLRTEKGRGYRLTMDGMGSS